MTFDDYMAHSKAAAFKIDQFFEAFSPGILTDEVESILDPTEFVGQTVGAHIDFPRNKDTGEPTSPYRGIERIFAIVDEAEFFGSGEATEGVNDTTSAEAAEVVELI